MFSCVWDSRWPLARDRGEDTRSSAGAAACVPGVMFYLGQQGPGWDLGKAASACPGKQTHGAVAELERDCVQVAMIIHLNTYFSSCVINSGTAAPAAPWFLCTPLFPLPVSGDGLPHLPPFSPPRTVTHHVPSSPGGPCTLGDRKG